MVQPRQQTGISETDSCSILSNTTCNCNWHQSLYSSGLLEPPKGNPLFFMVFSRVSTKNKDHCSYDRHVCLFYILLSTLDLWDAGTIPGLSLPQVVMVGHLVDGPQCPSARHRWFHSIPMLRPIPIWPSFASRQSPFIFSHYLLRNKFTFDFYFVLSKLHSRIWLPSGKPCYQ